MDLSKTGYAGRSKRAISIITFIILMMTVLAVGSYGFAQQAQISVTVQPAFVGVNVSPSSLDYGILPFSGQGESSVITATNTGNTAANFGIWGANATAGQNTWTLSANPGSEQYSHDFSTNYSQPNPTWTPLTTSSQTLATNVTGGGNTTFKLRLRMPTASSSTDQHSTNVTIMATMP